MSILSLFAISFLIYQVQPLSISKRFSKYLAQPCATKEGASTDDIDHLFDDQIPGNQVQKCLMACLGKEYLIVSN